MQIKYFKIPVKFADNHEKELNAFLSSHKISSITHKFVEDRDDSFWAVKIEYVSSAPTPSRNKNRVDYKEILKEEEFNLFNKLRELRKEVADSEGVPVYAIFSNEQLAEMVRKNVQNLEQFKAIAGIGEQKAGKYGQSFLDVLKENSSPKEM